MPQKTKARKPRNPAGRRGTPLSLYPLSFDDAVTALAQIRMPAESKRKKRKAQAAKGK